MGEIDVEVPERWTATREGRAGIDIDWVARFRDPKLRELVNEALANNQDLKAAAARLDQARQQARIAGAAGLPQSDLTFGGVRQKQNFIGFPIGGPDGDQAPGGVASSQFNQFNLGLDLRWEVDVWGRIRASRAAATADADSSAEEYRGARASLAAQVARAWFALAESRQQIALSKEAENIFQQTAEAVRERFQQGQEDAAATQLRLAETDSAIAKASVIERQQALATAERQLEVLVGRYPSGKLSSTAVLPSVPSRPPVGLPSELLRRRPDVLAAERRYAAAGKRLTEARRALFPRLALTSSSGTATGDLSEILNSDFGVWQLAGNVVQPILTGGQLIAEAKVRYSRESEALAALQQTVLSAFGEVETALELDRLLAEREVAVVAADQLAQDTAKSAQADYSNGLGDLLTVLTAQERSLQLRSQALTLRRLRLENRVNLHLALGGDFETRP